MTPGPGNLRKQKPLLARVCSPGREPRPHSGSGGAAEGARSSRTRGTPGASDPARGVRRGGPGVGTARHQIQPKSARTPLGEWAQSRAAASRPAAGTGSWGDAELAEHPPQKPGQEGAAR